MAAYRVDVNRDETGAWIAAVEGVTGAHTYGRSLRQVRTRVDEVLPLWIEDADTADLDFVLHFPRSVREALRRASSARLRAAEAHETAVAATAHVAVVLVRDFGISLRDAGEITGLSHQRVQQILAQSDAEGPVGVIGEPA